MKKISAIIFFITILILSCISISPPKYTTNPPQKDFAAQTIPIAIDINFSDFEKSEIENAIQEWNGALNNSLVLQVVSKQFDMDPEELASGLNRNELFILKIDSNSYLVPSEQTLAFTNDLGGNFMYIITDRIYFENLKEIVMHEMGHLLGADHDSSGLMMTHFDAFEFRCIDKKTMQQISLMHNLNFENLNYCL